MARTKLPAVKRREYTVEEFNALFHAGQKCGQKCGGGGRGGKRIGRAQAVQWDAQFVKVKAWVVRHGRYPRQKTSAEKSMYQWLRNNLPGGQSHTPDRWKKLNDAFGEGWEAGVKKGSPSHLEAKWDARLAEVKAWVLLHGRYPRKHKTSAETSMYYWLYYNLPGKKSHTPARWKKLNDAFGEGWEADFGKGAHESQLEAKWDARLVQVKAWVVRHRRYPGSSRKTSAERSMCNWLRHNLPGRLRHTPARWKKLTDAFGEGFEAAFLQRTRKQEA
jgi:hypothetical protein